MKLEVSSLVQTLIYVLPQSNQCYMQFHEMFDRVIPAIYDRLWLLKLSIIPPIKIIFMITQMLHWTKFQLKTQLIYFSVCFSVSLKHIGLTNQHTIILGSNDSLKLYLHISLATDLRTFVGSSYILYWMPCHAKAIQDWKLDSFYCSFHCNRNCIWFFI